MLQIKCVFAAIAGGVDIPEVLGVICYDRQVVSEGHKNYSKDCCVMNAQAAFLIFTSFLTQ